MGEEEEAGSFPSFQLHKELFWWWFVGLVREEEAGSFPHLFVLVVLLLLLLSSLRRPIVW
jgi:hypothetical protein